MQSSWTSLLWFSKVRERMERRSRSEGSMMHSSRNASVSYFSSLVSSSQTLKKIQEMWASFWYLHEELCTGAPLQSILALPMTLGWSLLALSLKHTSWVTLYSVLRPFRGPVCSSWFTSFQKFSWDSFPLKGLFTHSWILMYLDKYFLLGNYFPGYL